MSGKIKVLVLVLISAGAILFVCLALQKAEGAKPSSVIPLSAFISDSTGLKLQSDGLGGYLTGITPSGTVDVHLDQRYGYVFFYVDKGTNPQSIGRFVKLYFDDPVTDYPCTIPNMECCPDFPFAYANFEPQFVRMMSWYTFVPDPDDPNKLILPNSGYLNFAKMGMTVKEGKKTITYPAHAYVGWSIGFNLTVDGDAHHLGGGEYAAEVIADDIGPNGPRHWTIKSLTAPWHYWADITDDDRQLYRSHQELNTEVKCSYGRFNFPFQIELYRQ